MTEPLLLAIGVAAGARRHPLLHGVDLRLVAGEVVTLDAPTGTGSSLLLHTLAGLVPAAAGAVTICGGPAESAIGERRVALLEQEPALAPHLTCAETVSVPLRAGLRSPHEVLQRTAALLDAVGLTPAADQLVTELSGGQRQRTAFARCLAGRAPLVLVDDPTAALDADNRQRVTGLLERHAADGGAVLAVSHDPDLIAVASRRYTLAGGRLVPAPG